MSAWLSGRDLDRPDPAGRAGEFRCLPREPVDHLDLFEPGVAYRVEIGPLRRRATDTRAVLAGIREDLGWEILADEIRDRDAPARREHAVELPEDGVLVGHEVDDAV